MAIINTNISAVITQQAMAKNDRAMQTTMERLSTGKSGTLLRTMLQVLRSPLA